MSTKAKEIFTKIKALFADVPPPPPAPLAPPAGKPYMLQDGTTQISIIQAGDAPAVGDTVTINGTPAATSTYMLQDGSSITTDATGTITAVNPVTPITTDPTELGKPPAAPPAPAPAPPAAKFSATPENIEAVIKKMTPESMATVFEAFATGTPDDRIANLELVCKALMEYNFGWQIREVQQKATTDQAIEVYKRDLTTAQAALTKQDEVIKKQDEKLQLMLQLVEEISGMPSDDPKTLTGPKKEQFEKQKKREDRLEGIANAIKELKGAR